MFFSLFWTAYIPVGMIILVSRRAADALLPPAARVCLDCLFEPAPNQARARRRVLK
jgi:hypothetical protein